MASVSRKLPSKIYDIEAHSSKVTCLDIGETGRVLVTGGQDRNIKLWTFGNEKCFMTLPGHNASIDCVKFAYSDDFVYSADDTGVIKRWNLNVSDSISLFGHMKSVRTLDFHPYSDTYLVSGSNDTSIRLWDVRQKLCLKRYRGHMSHVNSVKFSPDGCWIASAGTEGSVIIWDIRMSKLFMEFNERQTPATCVKYHPTDLLMAAGRSDGTVDLYDLEKRQMITQTSPAPKSGVNGGNDRAVRCITFDESGKRLFVGSAAGITVVGWEPDREYDRLDATWSQLGDMKIAGSKLLFGTYEEASVAIHAVPLGHLRAFYNPQNQAQAFNHNQTSRKSFTRGSGKVRLSIGGTGGGEGGSGTGITLLAESVPEDAAIGSGNGGGMSPNLNIEMIDEEDAHYGGAFEFGLPPVESAYYPKGIMPDAEKEDFPVKNAQPPDYAPKGPGQSTAGITVGGFVNGNANSSTVQTTGTGSARTTNLRTSSGASSSEQRRPGSIHGGVGHSRSAGNLVRRLATSKSTLELNKIPAEENFTFKKPISRGSSPIRQQGPYHSGSSSSKIQRSESSAQITSMRNGGVGNNMKLPHNSNVKVQIVTKPVRSKTSLDIRHHGQHRAGAGPVGSLYGHRTSNIGQTVNIDPHGTMQGEYRNVGGTGGELGPQFILDQPIGPTIIRHGGHETSSSIEYEIRVLRNEHDTTLQALCNRTALLSAIRNYTKTGDVTGALKVAVRMNDQHILVDVLGAILEKTSQWTLDMCVLLLPKVYDLLQSEYKFHCTRACDTLRVILSTFLPVIRENTDPWGACTIGVDVSREERQSKCLECKNWLLRIRCLPENPNMGTNLQQLQSMIVDI